MIEERKSCGLFLVSPRWKAPQLHISVDGGEWRTIPMVHYTSNIFSVELDRFAQQVLFVFCENDKSKWINPSVELSQPNSYVSQNNSLNFRLQHSGHFIVLDGHLERIHTVEIEGNLLLSINVDGVLCGEYISLLNFKTALLKHFYFNRQIKLVYLTGRTFNSLLSHPDLLLPDYVATEGGSKIFRLRPEVPTQTLEQQYELIYISDISEKSSAMARQSLSQLTGLEAEFSSARINFVMNGLQLRQWKPQLKRFEQQLFEAGLESNFVSHGTTTFVDITNSGVNKASSLQKIARLEEGFKLVGFGSGCNDLGFLQLCGMAIVPCNIDKLTREVLKDLPHIKMSRCAHADCILEFLEQLAKNHSHLKA